jgi:hypothetical protein
VHAVRREVQRQRWEQARKLWVQDRQLCGPCLREYHARVRAERHAWLEAEEAERRAAEEEAACKARGRFGLGRLR